MERKKKFQSLIGTVFLNLIIIIKRGSKVSIPYRYGIPKKDRTLICLYGDRFQSLIGTVFQQYFRHFQTLSYFFFLKSIQKVCRPYFFIISNFPVKSSFYYKIKISLSVDRLFDDFLWILWHFYCFPASKNAIFLSVFKAFEVDRLFYNILNIPNP